MAQTIRLSDKAKEELAELKKKFREKTDNGAIEAVILDYQKVKKQLDIELKRANKFEQLFYDLRDTILKRISLGKKIKELIK